MTRNLPEWAYLVDDAGRYWYRLSDGARVPASGEAAQKAPPRAVYAIPTNDLVSHPQWVSSKDAEIISQVVSVENEKLGMKSDIGPGRTSDWKPVEINGTRTLVQSVSIPWSFENLTKGDTEFTDFLPQYSLYTPPENSVTLWRETSSWVVGYSRGDRWVHVQPLGEADATTIAGEIQLTLMELSAKGVIDEMERVVIWAPDDPAFGQELAEALDLPVLFRPHPAPDPKGSPDWDFVPHEVSRERLARARRRRNAWITVFAFLGVMLLVAAAAAHLWFLKRGNEQLAAKIDANRDAAAKIELAMDKWRALEPAIAADRSPVEIFYRVSSLVPEKGFRFTSFEVQDFDTIVVQGEGSTMANALQIEGKLDSDPALSQYEWEITPPRAKGDLHELRAIGTFRF